MSIFVLTATGRRLETHASFRAAYQSAREMGYGHAWPPNPTTEDARYAPGVLFQSEAGARGRVLARILREVADP